MSIVYQDKEQVKFNVVICNGAILDGLPFLCNEKILLIYLFHVIKIQICTFDLSFYAVKRCFLIGHVDGLFVHLLVSCYLWPLTFHTLQLRPRLAAKRRKLEGKLEGTKSGGSQDPTEKVTNGDTQNA